METENFKYIAKKLETALYHGATEEEAVALVKTAIKGRFWKAEKGGRGSYSQQIGANK